MISYGGVPLLSNDPEALARVEAVLSPEDLYDFARAAWPGRLVALGQSWLERETPPALNRLVWPAGATRWAAGWFLTDDAGLAVLRPQAYSGGSLTALPFVLSDGRSSVSTNLFMLPPRPLGQNGTGGDLYLLGLVDARYFWWETAAAVAVTAGTTTWAQLFAAYAAALGIALTVDPVPAAYLSPPGDFNTAYELLPPQLDAAARSVGMRFVRNFDGSCNVVGAATAATRLAADVALNPLAAGGLVNLMKVGAATTADLAGVLPSAVAVAFPTVDANDAPTGATTLQTTTLAGLVNLGTLPQYAGANSYPFTRLVHCSAGAGPSNTAQIAALASQIAADFYDWAAAPPDAAYAGVCPWTPTGYEDRVEYTYRPEEISTRVQRPPWNTRDEAALAYGSAGSVNNYVYNQYVTNNYVKNLVLTGGYYPECYPYTATTTTLNNWTPPAPSTMYAFTPFAGGTDLTGMVPAPVNGATLPQTATIVNEGPDPLTVHGDSAASLQANRFTFPPEYGATPAVILNQNDSVDLWWDGCAAIPRWRVLDCSVPPPTTLLAVENVNAPFNLVYPCTTLEADNDLAGVNDIQTLSVTGSPTSGAFQLAAGGPLAANVSVLWNETAAALQTALAADANIGVGNVAVTGGPLPGTPLVATFQGTLGSKPIPPFALGTNGLSGGSSPAPSVAHTTMGLSVKHARLLNTNLGGGAAQLDWQGLVAYLAGTGTVGPFADFEFSNAGTVSFSLALDPWYLSPTGRDSLIITANTTGGGSANYGSANLLTSYATTSALPLNVGLSITLPVAGTYFLLAQVSAQSSSSTGGPIEAQLYDTTAGVMVPNSLIDVGYAPGGGLIEEQSAVIAVPYTVTVRTVIDLQAGGPAAGGGATIVGHTGPPLTVLSFFQVAGSVLPIGGVTIGTTLVTGGTAGELLYTDGTVVQQTPGGDVVILNTGVSVQKVDGVPAASWPSSLLLLGGV